MSENKCSICKEKFEDEYFDKEQNKCILHCEKDNWLDNKEYWNSFEEESKKYLINKKIKKKKDNLVYENFIFENDFKMKSNKKYTFYNCIFYGKVIFVKNKKRINEFKNCYFKSNIELVDVSIKNRLTIENSYILGNFECQNTDFEFLLILKNSAFNKIVFNNVEFSEEAYFYNLMIKEKLDLSKSIFYKMKSFIYSDLRVSNRETARIIKDSFEQQNNIIEANKYYSLEMESRKEELERDNSTYELILFKLHSLSSDYSQNWIKAFLWLINIGVITSLFFFVINLIHGRTNLEFNFLTIFFCIFSFVLFLSSFSSSNKNQKWIMISGAFYCFYGAISMDFYLVEFFKHINPAKIFTGQETNLATLLFKALIAYLIYQLIISIRQNTRRK